MPADCWSLTPVDVAVDPLRFRVWTAGEADAEPVVCLHGFPEDGRAWSALATPLAAAGYRVIAPDQRGYSPGARPEPVDAYRMPNLVADVLGVADALGCPTFHLVGHDWGGAVAWQLAARHAERVRTLAVLSTPHPKALADALGGFDQRRRMAYVLLLRSRLAEPLLLGARQRVLRTLYRRTGLPEEQAEAYLRTLTGPGALRGALNWYRAVEGTDLRGLQPIDVPTLYVWGRHDPALGRQAAEDTARHVRGPYRFVVLDEGHWLPLRAAEAIAPLLVGHFSS